MQQCDKRNTPNRNHQKYRISRAFPTFCRLFYSRKMWMRTIHMIVIRHFRAAIIKRNRSLATDGASSGRRLSSNHA
jgi:hypothetical protein